MVSPSRRREQARDSQRKGRALRKAQLEALQQRVDALSETLETITEKCVQFADAAVLALGPARDERFLKAGIRPFLQDVLDVARFVEETCPKDALATQEAYSGGKVSGTERRLNTLDENARGRALTASFKEEATAGRSTDSFPTVGTMSPRLTYGLFATESRRTSGPPMDINKFLLPDTRSAVPFGTTLFWNTLAFAYQTLENRPAMLMHALFNYALRFSSIVSLTRRMRHRLFYRPRAVSMYISTPGSESTISGATDDQDVSTTFYRFDVDQEARDLAHNHELISNAMSTMEDNSAFYLDCTDVEGYLSSHWGIGMLESKHSLDTFADSHVHTGLPLSSHGVHKLINELVPLSKCMGNHIGFHIESVDRAALAYLQHSQNS